LPDGDRLFAGIVLKGEAVSFTPEVDKWIIEGFLGDRASMLKELSEAGFDRRAIFERAKELGLTDEFIKQCHLTGVDVALRKCLRCDEIFASMGPHNRICRRCQGKQYSRNAGYDLP
jgi:hypothetical protein